MADDSGLVSSRWTNALNGLSPAERDRAADHLLRVAAEGSGWFTVLRAAGTGERTEWTVETPYTAAPTAYLAAGVGIVSGAGSGSWAARLRTAERYHVDLTAETPPAAGEEVVLIVWACPPTEVADE